MKFPPLLLMMTLTFTSSVASVFAHEKEAPLWSHEAHDRLIEMAFPDEREDCLAEIKEGSEWVDRKTNQLPSGAYQHAMRGSYQSVEDAREKMARFVAGYAERALIAKDRSTQKVNASPSDPLAEFTHDGLLITDRQTYLEHCRHRGIALHPVMDSTSPAHGEFGIWTFSDIAGMLEHGDMPFSLEDEQALLSRPDLMSKTVGLMRILDRVYLEFRFLDFRFNF